MAAYRGSSSKWFFTREQLESTPSRRCGVEPDRELSYRQQAANLIQDMGQRLNVYPFKWHLVSQSSRFGRKGRPRRNGGPALGPFPSGPFRSIPKLTFNQNIFSHELPTNIMIFYTRVNEVTKHSV